MTGKGHIVGAPRRQLRLMAAAHVLWLAAVCTLGGWWGYLALRQAERIQELEVQLGDAAQQALAYEQWHRMQRMLFWESGAFLVLVLLSTALLAWLYWRDVRRARSLHAFFASLSHELRTPLTSIRLQAESIADAPGVGEQAQPLIQRLLEDTTRLESQVERTLELARVEGGGPILTQPISLKPLVERLARDWSETHRGSVELRTHLRETQVQADVSAVQVILKNLLENTVRHSRKATPTVEIRSTEVAGHAGLLYRDDGQGFSGPFSSLGELFQKGADSQGAGVGLYLVKVLMERMGGSARFGNRTDRTGFEIELRFVRSEGLA